MQTYELTYIIADSVADDKTPHVMLEVTKELERLGAVIIKEEAWGKRKLAYPIKKSVYGTYVTLQTHLEGVKVKEVDHFLQLLPTVIRHLMTTVVPQTIKVTDEAELSQALDKRVEEKIAHKEVKAAPVVKEEVATEEIAEELEEKPKRKVTKSTNEEEKKEEAADERKKLVEEKLSEILGEE